MREETQQKIFKAIIKYEVPAWIIILGVLIYFAVKGIYYSF